MAMVNEFPDISKESHWNMGESARILGIGRRTLYSWLDKKLIKQPRISRMGTPFYTGDDLHTIWSGERYIKARMS